MIENQDIVQGAITKTKLSKNLRLDLTNLPKGTVGQIPVVQADGNWGLVDLSGDISIAADGATTVVNNATINSADIDTAFNFLTNQQGFIFRKGQQNYTVDNRNYATEKVAAAHADHAVSSSGSKRFALEFVWGTDQTGLVFSSSDDVGSVGTFTHGLKTKDFIASIRSVNAESGSGPSGGTLNKGYAADELTDVAYDPFRIVANTTTTLQLHAQDVSSSSPWGTWAITIVG